MNYNLLLDLATDLGYELAMSGAETYRVEESISRVLASYDLDSEVFAIPNNLTVSIICGDGHPMTRMRRIGYHGNDIYGVERFSALSRRICNEKPDVETAMEWLVETRNSKKEHTFPIHMLGNFLGAGGFAIFYGGSLLDGLCAGFCGLLVGLINRTMDKLQANQFFRTILAAFPMAIVAYAMAAVGVADNADAVVIGALMILVPGLLFTNAMRDIIFGDTNSGTIRIVQVLLIAVAIACGTGAAWNVAATLFGEPASVPTITYSFLEECLPCIIGCVGFAIIFNIHGPGMSLCALGGLLTWSVYRLTMYLGGTDITAFFWSCTFAAVYAEIMARIRKYPAIGYLLVSIFPLIPGAGVYYTMNYAIRGDMDMFAQKGMHTISVAGVMAVAILLVSTTVRLRTDWKLKHQKKPPLK
jgi:uncharacterized membrane protein YjjP (DUF1212 family)